MEGESLLGTKGPAYSAVSTTHIPSARTTTDVSDAEKRTTKLHLPSKTPARSRILWFRGLLHDLSVLAPVIILSTIGFAAVFYRLHNGWEVSTAIYYATQTTVGVMYGVPEGEDRISMGFTLFLYFLGATYIYAAVAAYANLIAERTVASAKDIVQMERSDLGRNGIILPRHWFMYWCNLACNALDWNHNKFTLITVGATLAWVFLGVMFGLHYEGYDLFTSIYFSLDAMMLSGSLAPPCKASDEGENICSLGSFRGLFMSLYLLVGSTLFILTMGQFYESLVHSAQMSHQRQKYLRKFTQEEFDYAAKSLRCHSCGSRQNTSQRSVDLNQFLILELLRIDAIDHEEIMFLKSVFENVDKERSGLILYDEINNSTSDVMAEIIELNEASHLHDDCNS